MKILARSFLCLFLVAFFARNATATTITTQPSNVSIACGDNATFSVSASGGPLSYQWQDNGTNIFNGSNVTGANSDTVIVRNATSGGAYTVIVTDANGSVTSSVVSVVINNDFTAPVITVTGADTVFPTGTMLKGSDGYLYGVTRQGGAFDQGWIFRTTTNGDFTILHEFTGGLDGGNPQGGLTFGQSGNLYGTTYIGGTNNLGTVFKIDVNGFASIYSFQGGALGSRPQAALTLGNDGNLYGTTDYDGTNYSGAAFMITPAGAFTFLHAFKINVDGNGPQAPMILANDGNFYGTTFSSVFKMTPAGLVTPLVLLTNGEGPVAGLVQGQDGKFYGTTHHRGNYDFGYVFSITTNGATNILYNFTGGGDGGNPDAELVQASNGLLYGTTDGENGASTVFSISTNGVFNALHYFSGNADGRNPHAGLTLVDDSTFYGTTTHGGANNGGTIFSMTPAGTLNTVYDFHGNGFTLVECHSPYVDPGVVATDACDGTVTIVTNANRFQIAHKFDNHGDLEAPLGGLTVGPDGNLYGTASFGGANLLGGIYKLTPTGAYTVLYSLKPVDGKKPSGALVMAADGNFYGATVGSYDHTSNDSTLFRFNPNTGAYTTLVSPAGIEISQGLTLGADGNLYGTSVYGGSENHGIFFRLTTNGVQTILYNFTFGGGIVRPAGPLLLAADGSFYGVAVNDPYGSYGGVYNITTNGTLAVVNYFTDYNGNGGNLTWGHDGKLYGTTFLGGANSFGQIFSLTLQGTFTSLYSFAVGTNGYKPIGGLTLGMDGNFYGMTYAYGLDPNAPFTGGTVYRMTPDGAFTALARLDPAIGISPAGPLTEVSPGVFYGTTAGDVTINSGDIFRLDTEPNPNMPGDYFVQYVAKDSSGNSTTNGRVVHVQDTIAPSINLNTVTNVVFWGNNGLGQGFVTMVTNAVAVSGGYDHALALRSDGTVYVAGSSSSGQFNVPSNLTNAVAVSAGSSFDLALTADGNVMAWGDNSAGQRDVSAGLSDVQKIAAGTQHALALKTDGSVVAWGSSFNGATTVPDAASSDVIAIAAGYEFSVALKSDGTVIAWGLNTSGQTNVPVGARNITAIAAGADFVIALKSDNTVIGWGGDNDHQIDIPVNLNGVIAISAGTTHAIAQKSNGSFVGWGSDYYGETEAPFGLNNVTSFCSAYYYNIAVQKLGGASITVECHSPFTDPGATAVDACSGNFAATPEYPFGPVDLNSVGNYSLKYAAADASGNAATSTFRSINVVDTTPPVITLNGNAQDYAGLGLGYADPGVTASDLCSGSVSIVTNGSVITGALGDYTLTYVATDSSGNAASVVRVVSVINSTPPVITQGPSSASVNAGATVTFHADVTGSPLNYQWYFNGTPAYEGTPFAGTTTDTLTNSYALLNNAGDYQLVVTNLLGAVTSDVVHLTVYGVAIQASSSLNGFYSAQPTGLHLDGNHLYLSGVSDNDDGDGFVARYELPFSTEANADWYHIWPEASGPDELNAVTVLNSRLYFAGAGYSTTHDSYGAKESKGLLLHYDTQGPVTEDSPASGPIFAAQVPPSPGAFPFSGNETLKALDGATEGVQSYLYAAGVSQSSVSNPGRMFLSKVSTNGDTIWTKTDVSPGVSSLSYSAANGLIVLDGAIYVAGRSDDSGASKAFVRKYDNAGNLIWSSAATSGYFNAVIGYNHAIYSVGATSTNDTSDFLIEKRDQTGRLLWSRTFDNTGGADVLYGITVLKGYLYAVGSTKDAGANMPISPALLLLDPATGDNNSLTTWGHGPSFNEAARCITTDSTNLYVVTDSTSSVLSSSMTMYSFESVQVEQDLSLVTAASQIPGAILGQPYQFVLQVAGGTPPYTWTSVGLPLGLTLSSSGLISGIPTQDGTFGCSATVTDSGDDADSRTRAFDISVFDNNPTTLTLNSPTNGAIATAPASFNLSVSASGELNSVTLGYYNGNTPLPGYSLSGLPVGSYAFYALGTNVANLVATTAVSHVTVEAAGTQLIDFEALDTSAAEVAGSPLNAYLSNFGITPGNVTAGSHLAVRADASGNNSLSQYGLNGAVSYTLSFAAPHVSVSWTRPVVPAGIFQPAWTIHAFDGSGNELGFVSEGLINSASDTTAKTFTLFGPDIASIRVDANNRSFGLAASLALDNVVLSDNPTTSTAPTATLTSPANGLTLSAPGTVTVSAQALPGDGTLDHLELYSGSTLISTNASVTLQNLAPGVYSFHAIAVNSFGVGRSSATATVTVNAIAGISIINFDSLDTTSGNASSASLSNYLAGFGLSLSNVSVGTAMQAANINNLTGVIVSSPENLLIQSGGKAPASFTLNLAAPVNALSFTRPALRSGAIHPQWTASAYNASGVLLTKIGENLLAGPIDSRVCSLVAPGIRSVRFDSDSQNTATFTAVLLDDLVLNGNPVTSPLSVAITSPAEAASFTAPASVAITVNAQGPVSLVTFFAGPNVIGVATNSPYAFTWTNVLAGAYSLTASALDTNGSTLYSAPVHVLVNAGVTGGALINFDALDASIAPISGAPLTNYLATFGVTIAAGSVSSNTVLAVKDQRNVNAGASVAASSPNNILTQTGSNAPVSYTLNFRRPLTQFGFTRPKLLARPRALHPAWTVTALNAVGVPLTQTNEAAINSTTEVPAQSFNLTAAGISSVKFASLGNSLAPFDAALFDDFVLTTNADNILPSIVLTNPAASSHYFTRAIIPIGARALDSDGLVTQVVFFANAAQIGKVKAAPFTMKWTNNIPGIYSLTAVASDNHGATQTSPAVSVNVAASGFGLKITSQPSSLVLASGSLASFGVTGLSRAPITYQWRFNDADISGETNQNLNLSGVTTDNDGTYSVVLFSGTNSVTSTNATLTVLDAPYIVTPPASQTVNIGDQVVLNVEATGAPVLSYQWLLNGARISDQTNASLTLSNAQAFNSGNYQVTVANSVGLAISDIASIAVQPGGAITPSADNFEDRLPFNPLLAAAAGNNESATAQTGEPRHSGHRPKKSIWFTWHATFTGEITLTTLGSGFDTVLAVYTGSSLTNLTPVASDDDSGGFYAAQVTFAVTTGVDYQIAVDGYRGASGNVILGLPAGQGYRVLSAPVAAALPVITVQPSNQVVRAAQDVNLSVTATSSGTLNYQWYFNDSPLAAQVSSNLLVKHFTEANVGRYEVVVANDDGSIRSLPADIQLGTVNNTNTAVISTEDKFGNSVDLSNLSATKYDPKGESGGDSRSFTVSQVFSTVGASKELGEPNHCGQAGGSSVWYTFTAATSGTLQVDTAGSSFNTILAVYTGPGTDFASLIDQACGYTTNALTDGQPHLSIPNVVSNTTFFIVVDGYQGANGSAHLRISLGQAPVIVSNPKDQPTGPGSTANFNVLSTGSTNLFYQWRLNDDLIPGATGTALAVSSVQTNVEGLYTVVVSNAIGVVTSAPPALLALQYAPLITVQPTNMSVNLSQAAHFTVAAGGIAPLRYQWYFNNVLIAKATNTVLSFTSAKWTNNGVYSVTVSNSYGIVTSDNAVLFAGDITPPTITITTPAANSITTNAILAVHGTAADGAGVAGVYFQVNGGATNLATGTNSWTANALLVPGTNTFTVKALDLSSNSSLVLARKFFYSYPTPLTVQTNGYGAIKSSTGALNGALLQIGKNYTITAFVPSGDNSIFTNWTGGLVGGGMTTFTNSTNLIFMMASNLVLQANFVTNPFTPASGVYNGLFYPISGIAKTNSGLLSLTIASTSKGAFSGKILLDGGSNAFSGTFDMSGNVTKIVTRTGKTPVTLNLHLNLHPTDDLLTGSVSTVDWFAGMVADHAVFNLTNRPNTNFVGRYTVEFPLGDDAPTIAPGGYGFALVTNNLAGTVSFVGSLGDGTAFSQSVPVSKDGRLPLYTALYSGKGFLMGWLNFTNSPKTVLGNVSWIKTNSTATAFYQTGFTNLLPIVGSLFTNPAPATRIIDLTNNATLTIQDGDLASPLIYTVRLLSNNIVTNIGGLPTNKFSMKFTNSNGAMVLTFRPTGATVDKTARGAVSQSQTNAAGWFQGTTHTGSVLLQP